MGDSNLLNDMQKVAKRPIIKITASSQEIHISMCFWSRVLSRVYFPFYCVDFAFAPVLLEQNVASRSSTFPHEINNIVQLLFKGKLHVNQG